NYIYRVYTVYTNNKKGGDMSKAKIWDAYRKMAEGKGYVYISDLQESSELSEADFDKFLTELISGKHVEMETGFGQWSDSKKPFEYDGQEFFGVKWNSEIPAFEKIWLFRAEIMEAWESSGVKNDAVKKAEELTGLKAVTVKQNLQPLPFLYAEFSKAEEKAESARRLERENTGLGKRVQQLETAHQAILAELDTKTAELNRESEEDMHMTESIEARFEAMQEQINALSVLIPRSIPEVAMPEVAMPEVAMPEVAMPEKFKIGKWSVVHTKRGYFMATRRYPTGPVSIHCGKEKNGVEVVLKEKLNLKGIEIDF
ncbi:hypothetical protein QUF80_07855, partial [Desulfococcaceae bacterium HSG8]|nr:hypothetical protein [Desulfococcaceae bacterium HSG8]